MSAVGSENNTIPRAILGFLLGSLVLFVAHISLNPAPNAAYFAYIAGALGFLMLRSDIHSMVVLLATAGAGVGVALHRNSHLTGASPTPPSPMLEHLVVEGLIGLLVGLGALFFMGGVMRILERR